MKNYNIRDFGAVADRDMNNAAAIQAAIDACTAGGGGRVTVPSGTYMTGMIEMRTGVELHIEAGGVLLASPRREDFPEKERRHVDARRLSRFSAAAMIFAEECEDISITGEGTLDGNGYAYVVPCAPYHSGWNYKRKDHNTLPRIVLFTGCKSVRIEDITVVDAPAGWCFWVHDCDLVDFRRVKILCEPTLPNVDGIHINSSRDVRVSDCIIRTGDDCIVAFSDNTPETSGSQSGSHGLGASELEKTRIENISFHNITMKNIYLRSVEIEIDPSPDTPCEEIRDITFSHIRAEALAFPSLIGRADCPLKNLRFESCDFRTVPKERIAFTFEATTREATPMTVRFAENVTFDDTAFSAEE